MGWEKSILVILILASVSFAFVIHSGDGGIVFANQKAAEMCGAENVKAVYTCNGNVVRVVSSISGEGSIFYKPDGRVISCPVVEPTKMGAECLQMMIPNYCPAQAKCGSSVAPDVFPGQNDTPEQTGDSDYYVVTEKVDNTKLNENTESTPKNTPAMPNPKTISKSTSAIVKTPSEGSEIHSAFAIDAKTILDNLVYLLLMLGIFSVAVLFMLFKKSINEDAA